jgi:hypothetical protein
MKVWPVIRQDHRNAVVGGDTQSIALAIHASETIDTSPGSIQSTRFPHPIFGNGSLTLLQPLRHPRDLEDSSFSPFGGPILAASLSSDRIPSGVRTAPPRQSSILLAWMTYCVLCCTTATRPRTGQGPAKLSACDDATPTTGRDRVAVQVHLTTIYPPR